MPDAEMILYEELQTIQERLWKKEECYLCLEKEWRDQSEEIKVERNLAIERISRDRYTSCITADTAVNVWPVAIGRKASVESSVRNPYVGRSLRPSVRLLIKAPRAAPVPHRNRFRLSRFPSDPESAGGKGKDRGGEPRLPVLLGRERADVVQLAPRCGETRRRRGRDGKACRLAQ